MPLAQKAGCPGPEKTKPLPVLSNPVCLPKTLHVTGGTLPGTRQVCLRDKSPFERVQAVEKLYKLINQEKYLSYRREITAPTYGPHGPEPGFWHENCIVIRLMAYMVVAFSN